MLLLEVEMFSTSRISSGVRPFDPLKDGLPEVEFAFCDGVDLNEIPGIGRNVDGGRIADEEELARKSRELLERLRSVLFDQPA